VRQGNGGPGDPYTYHPPPIKRRRKVYQMS
jgi:hypothetical protein